MCGPYMGRGNWAILGFSIVHGLRFGAFRCGYRRSLRAAPPSFALCVAVSIAAYYVVPQPMPPSYTCRRVTLELCFDLKRCILSYTSVSPHAGRQAFAPSRFTLCNTVLHLAGVPTNLAAHHHCCRAEWRWTGDNSPFPCSDHPVHARDMPCARFI